MPVEYLGVPGAACNLEQSAGSWRLSKSKLTTFQHCARRLWLQVHRREVGVVDRRTELLFDTGHRVGEVARFQVPNGILIDPDPRHLVEALVETSEALQRRRPLFEPAFMRNGIVARIDILEPQPTDSWKLVEVKNSGAVRPYQLRDIASQAWVLAGNGVKLSSLTIRLPRQVFRPGRRGPMSPGFIDFDVTTTAGPLMQEVPEIAALARRTLDGAEPERPVGPHCTHPFRCEFITYCSQRQEQARGSKERQI